MKKRKPKQRRKISVTARHIKYGVPNCPAACPVALAVAEHFGGGRIELPTKPLPWVDVCADSIRINEDDYGTPWQVYNFMQSFDHGRPVKPFSFYLSK